MGERLYYIAQDAQSHWVSVLVLSAAAKHFKALPEYRSRVESYPLFSLAALCLLAMLCGATRGQTELEKFASGFNHGQRRALGIRPNRQANTRRPLNRPSVVF